jgi:hypothetical protein
VRDYVFKRTQPVENADGASTVARYSLLLSGESMLCGDIDHEVQDYAGLVR